MISVKKLLYKVVERLGNTTDWVVEQGTSSGWRYRKWNSGVYECSQQHHGSIAVNIASAGYGGYRSSELSIPTFPITFTGVPTLIATMGTGSQGTYVNNVQPTRTGGIFYLACAQSQSAYDRYIHFYAIGRWK